MSAPDAGSWATSDRSTGPYQAGTRTAQSSAARTELSGRSALYARCRAATSAVSRTVAGRIRNSPAACEGTSVPSVYVLPNSCHPDPR